MLIMETREKRMSVHKTMMRRRAFTTWANLLLRSVDKQIVDIFNANERCLLDLLLDIVLTKSEKKLKRITGETKRSLREAILSRSQAFNENYYKEKQGQRQDTNRAVVIQFVWDLIEYFHISPGRYLWQNEETTMNAKDVLLHWVNGKLQGRTVRNFTSDWKDGVVLCELINSIEPGLISPKVYLQGSWPRKNVKVAIETAEKAWGIPEILSPDDIICSEVDELSVMTYVSLFFEYDLQSLSTNHVSALSNGHVDSDSRKTTIDGNEILEKVANTSNNKVEKKTDIGKVGNVVEYILNFHDVKANEITVSVEYKPLEELTEDYKPDLKVYSLGKSKFRVKYVPNVAGNYRLSMFYQGEHVGDSPYCVKVLPGPKRKENGKIDTNNNAGKNNIFEKDTMGKSYGGKYFDGNKAPPFCHGDASGNFRKVASENYQDVGTFYGFDGAGLREAVVGKLAVFTIITDNRDKGPLSVCINCPAVSIPVPHVTTTYSQNYSTHVIAYMPTLAGTYTIYVRWGLKLINGRPFQVDVRDYEVGKPRFLSAKGSEAYNKKRQSTEFSHIKVYYSSTSLDPAVIEDTTKLEKLFARYGLTKGGCSDMWVSIDIELERDERDLVFRLAGTRRLPLVFIHEKCLGGYERVSHLDKIGELEESLKYKIRKV